MPTELKTLKTRGKQLFLRLVNVFSRKIRRVLAEPSSGVIEEFPTNFDPRFGSALLSMYRGDMQLGEDGQMYHIDNITGIYHSQGIWLYNFCLSLKPKSTLEIGMAYGYSTLYFLAAIAKNQAGHHTAIDPFQSSFWHGIGRTHANTLGLYAGLNSSFLIIEDRSDRVATDLVRSNSIFDLIFIDGNHRFDDVLVDFYLYAPLCAIGGHIVFDDMWMRSIQTVVAFVRNNRTDFVEIASNEANICVFQRTGDDSRSWNDFNGFL